MASFLAPRYRWPSSRSPGLDSPDPIDLPLRRSATLAETIGIATGRATQGAHLPQEIHALMQAVLTRASLRSKPFAVGKQTPAAVAPLTRHKPSAYPLQRLAVPDIVPRRVTMDGAEAEHLWNLAPASQFPVM